MLNKEIYRGALRLIGEPCDEMRTEDYVERAPYILANFISENAKLDGQYRAFCGEAAGRACSSVYVSLDAEFPLCARFVSAAEYYLASMLLDGEDDDRADDFFDLYCRALADILTEIPATREKILNVYGA